MESFDIGRVLSRMFNMVWAGFKPAVGFVLLASVVSFLLQLIFNPAAFGLYGQLFQGNFDPATLAEASQASQGNPFSPLYWIGLILSLVVSCFIVCGTTDVCLKVARGEAAGFSSCIQAGLKNALPMMGFMLLYGLVLMVVIGIGVGITYFITGWIGIPLMLVGIGIILAVLGVSVPAIVNEGVGPIGAFGRSWSLTEGNRVMIFLTFLLWLIILFVALLVFVLIMALIGVGLAMISPWLATLMIIPYVVLLVALQLFSSGSMASVYAELRQIKEGGDSRLTDVFS